MHGLVIGLVAALGFAGAAHAEVVDAQANGFQVTNSVEVSAPADAVWKAMIEPSRWWASSHTFTGDAANMRLEARPGGCFCEVKGGGGGASTMRVSFVDPGKEIDIWGAIGPLSRLGATGGWTLVLTPEGPKTKVTWTYTVGGYEPGGLNKISAPVDHVMAEQLARLKAYVETGKAD
ncbi:MAG: SRPBCC domain-containing protein [Proteobacteria bacterium]|nr:SRPBCC domain-containing protein [Pseudomonadota bacterium]